MLKRLRHYPENRKLGCHQAVKFSTLRLIVCR